MFGYALFVLVKAVSKISVSEQQYFEIEKQLIESNTKLESESSSNEQLKEQLKDLGKTTHTSMPWYSLKEIFHCMKILKLYQ